jgi:hypothetical protein
MKIKMFLIADEANISVKKTNLEPYKRIYEISTYSLLLW